MKQFNGLAQFSRFMERQAVASVAVMEASVGVMAHTVHKRVYDTFGDETKLTPLKSATIEQKAKKGYPDPSAPLIATGELRDSLEVKHEGAVAGVGTSDMKMVYHEFGTSRGVPPRPALQIGLNEAAKECEELFKDATALAIGIGVRVL